MPDVQLGFFAPAVAASAARGRKRCLPPTAGFAPMGVGYTLFAATRSCGAPVRAFPGITTMCVTLPSLKALRKRG